VTALLGQIHLFSGGDVLEVDDGICYSAFGTDEQAFEAHALFAIRVADLGIFGNSEVQFMRHWPRPFDDTGDAPSVSDGDDFVIALRGGEGRGREKKRQQKTTSNGTPHIPPLITHRPFTEPHHQGPSNAG
jgi:hypothetical protein